MNLRQRFKRLNFWNKIGVVAGLCSIVGFVGWVCQIVLARSGSMRGGDSSENSVQVVSESPDAIVQSMQNSPGGVQVGGDLVVHPDPSRYTPLKSDLLANVTGALTALRAQYGTNCPGIELTVETGSRNRDLLVDEIEETLRASLLDVKRSSLTVLAKHKAPLGFVIKVNPNDIPFAKDLCTAISPFLRPPLEARHGTNHTEGIIKLFVRGDPEFYPDGSVRFH